MRYLLWRFCEFASVEIAVASIQALLAMKGPVPDRRKKDAYDIYYTFGTNRDFGCQLQLVHRHYGQSQQRQSRRRARGKRHGATLVYLPPYSPDLNPIEQAFAKLKALLRNIAARTVARLWDAVGDQLDRFTPQECVNYLANAGYVPLVRG